MAKILHTMIRVFEEARSVAFYKKAFNLDISNRRDFDGFTLVYIRNSEADVELELTINKDRIEPYKHGDGYGHVAFCVDDVEKEHSRLTASGLSPTDVVNFENEGERIARFFFITDPDGYEIEVLEKFGHYQ